MIHLSRLLTLLGTLVVALGATPVLAETYNAHSPQHEAAVKLFQSNEEPTTKEAIWTAVGIFKVAVFDDGTRRDGYAQHVCEVLYDYGFRGKKVWVQVIDIIKLTPKGKWKKLGEAHCQ